MDTVVIGKMSTLGNSITMYLLHLYLTFLMNKGVSIGLGIVESVSTYLYQLERIHLEIRSLGMVACKSGNNIFCGI